LIGPNNYGRDGGRLQEEIRAYEKIEPPRDKRERGRAHEYRRGQVVGTTHGGVSPGERIHQTF